MDSLLKSSARCRHYRYLLDIVKKKTIGIDDFVGLPFVDKRMVRENPDQFIIPDHVKSDLIAEYTSGSTGVPITCYRSRKEQLQLGMILNKLRRTFKSDIVYDRSVEFGAFANHITNNRHPNKETIIFSSYFTESRDLAFYRNKLKAFNPTFVQGFPSSLFALSKYILEGGEELVLPNLKFIEARSEIMTPKQKQMIENVFKLSVANHYGSKEFWTMAYSCSEGQMHIVNEAVHIEVVAETGKPVDEGEVGEIIVTGKVVYSMPLIRYRIGDLGIVVPGSCSCGSPNKRIMIIGRESSDITTARGKKNRSVLAPIWRIIHAEPNVVQAQIVQHSLRRFSILYMGNGPVANHVCSHVEHVFKALIGDPELVVEIDRVETIGVDQVSGKMKEFISHVKPEEIGS